jgi:hypothetical protein
MCFVSGMPCAIYPFSFYKKKIHKEHNMYIGIDDYYNTPKLTGTVYFDGSNDPCSVVLHNWHMEYSLGNSAKAHGVPPPKG